MLLHHHFDYFFCSLQFCNANGAVQKVGFLQKCPEGKATETRGKALFRLLAMLMKDSGLCSAATQSKF